MNRKINSQFKSEEELRNRIINILVNKGIQPIVEIPFLGRSIDLAYTCKDGSITVMEIKRFPKHIRIAIDQSKYCLLGADRVYVCVPEYKMTPKIRNLFFDIGVGLIFLTKNGRKYYIKYEIPSIGSETKKQDYYFNKLRKTMLEMRKQK